ncbi:MAG: hypothetical protein RIS47_264 [Bacteroidota bacterium]
MTTQPNIAVGILTAREISFCLKGDFTASFSESFEDRNMQFAANNSYNYVAKIEHGQICISDLWGEKLCGKELVFRPRHFESDSFELQNVVIGIDFHWEQTENQSFQGVLKLVQNAGRIVAVNLLPIESYLLSVISSEMSAQSSLALLKAHAVISRSWLLAQILKQTELQTEALSYQSIVSDEGRYIRWYDREDHRLFHVCADDHCQRYQGLSKLTNEAVKQAVAETAGMVLSYEGKICDARFSKSCGGVTELFENCWEPVAHPYLASVVDFSDATSLAALNLTIEPDAKTWIETKPQAFCNTTDPEILSHVLNNYDQKSKDFYRWEQVYEQDELSALIELKSGHKFGLIKALIPLERGVSGRITQLRIVGTELELTVGKELEIRRWLSNSHLYSSAFVVDAQDSTDGIPQRFVIRGAGWGHGVGLCQIGAAVMGAKGYAFDEILLHYFTDAVLNQYYEA